MPNSIYFGGGSGGSRASSILPEQAAITAVSSLGGDSLEISASAPTDAAGVYLVRNYTRVPESIKDGTKFDMKLVGKFVDTAARTVSSPTCHYRVFSYGADKSIQTSRALATFSTVDTDYETFKLPKFTGSHIITGNAESGRITLYSSGMLTLSSGLYDVFLVGGGGGMEGTSYNSATNVPSHMGASGGQTKTFLSVELSGDVSAQVGSGGLRSNGFPSRLGDMEAVGGLMGRSTGYTSFITTPPTPPGVFTGSGGGSGTDTSSSGLKANGGAGGSDGSNGSVISARYGFPGQGTTTRAFGEPTETLYAGGGGGGSVGGTVGAGGAGGGAGGTTISGTANSGGGSASAHNNSLCWAPSSSSGVRLANNRTGGSGIIIVRWNNTTI